MRVLITNGYIVYYFNVVAFKTEIYDDDDDDPRVDAYALRNKYFYVGKKTDSKTSNRVKPV